MTKPTLILFSTNNLPLSLLIRLGTGSKFSHVDLIEPSEHEGALVGIGASPSRGVAFEWLEDRIEDASSFAVYAVEADAEKVFSEAESRLGDKFDYAGCAGIVSGRNWQEEGSWLSSELVAKCFLEAGTPLLPERQAGRITPEGLLRSPLLKNVTSQFMTGRL